MRRASGRWPTRRAMRIAMASAAALLGAFAVTALAQPPTHPTPPRTPTPGGVSDFLHPSEGKKSETPLVEEGRGLFEEGCSSCHGFDGAGVEGQGPSLRGAGEAAADFYLRTGRMPLDQVGEQPLRGEPRYDEDQIRALDAYVGSLGPGPAIPAVHPGRGSLSEGMQLFADSCAGCHGIAGKGGVAIGAYAPPLGEATPTQVAEAIRVGPYVMPRFSDAQLDSGEVDSIARYVQLTQDPDDAGGFGIGHIGPVPEGLVAWLAAIAALLLIARLIGERNEDGERRKDEGGQA
jgi:quinol---cytochrome-c reductase cytochrome c subunit